MTFTEEELEAALNAVPSKFKSTADLAARQALWALRQTKERRSSW